VLVDFGLFVVLGVAVVVEFIDGQQRISPDERVDEVVDLLLGSLVGRVQTNIRWTLKAKPEDLFQEFVARCLFCW
jgi:hypothetical protein